MWWAGTGRKDGSRQSRGNLCRLSRWPPSCSCWGMSLKVTGSKTIRHQSPCSHHLPEAVQTHRPYALWTGGPRFPGRVHRCVGAASGQPSFCCQPAPSRTPIGARSRRWFGCPTCRTNRMSRSRRCVMAGRWNRALWWCTGPPAPGRCGERSIPRPLTPSSLYADVTLPGGRMRCISRTWSCPRNSRPPARRPWEKSRRAPAPTWRDWNPTDTFGYRWRPESHRLTHRPTGVKPPMWRLRAMGAPVGGRHPRHGPAGGDHRRGGIPVAHAPVGMHGARGGCLHHWSAPAQGSGGPVPWHQGADLASGQRALNELES